MVKNCIVILEYNLDRIGFKKLKKFVIEYWIGVYFRIFLRLVELHSMILSSDDLMKVGIEWKYILEENSNELFAWHTWIKT